MALALAIPDICGAIEFPKLAGEYSSNKRYRGWFDEWGGMLESLMTSEDCWAARCRYLHRGREEFTGRSAEATPLSRIQFTVGQSGGGWISQYIAAESGGKGAVRIPLEDFCKGMITGAIAWLNARGTDEQVMREVDDLLEIRTASQPSTPHSE